MKQLTHKEVALVINFHDYENEVINLRREFHKIAEPSTKEYNTQNKIIEYLESIGIKDIKKCADTGVVAFLCGNGDKTVGVRADIDALMVKEETELTYKSQNEGVMHACGHDGHIAIGLVLAKIFSDNKAELKGNVKFIFQPAEEDGYGAKRMIKDGALENPYVDYLVSCHLWPQIDTGKIDITRGATFASSDIINVKVMGKGGHGALPHLVKDSLYSASKIAVRLKELGIELNKKGIKNVLSVCSFDCKSEFNIFKDDAYLKGTLRAFDKKEREIIINEMKNAVKLIAEEDEITAELEVVVDCPSLVNNDKLVDIARNVIDENKLIEFGPVMPAEDFAYFSDERPSVHLKIGSGGEDVKYPVLHNSKYELNEKSLIIGVEALYNVITELYK